MILENFDEEEILKELVADYTKNVKPTVKKRARKRLDYFKSHGRFIREEEYEFMHLSTKLYNTWNTIIKYDMTQKAPWSSTSCCVVESPSNKTKDYYILRGLNDKPYFVKLSAHVVKRLKERNSFNLTDMDYVPCIVFDKHETAISVHFADFEYLKVLNSIDNTNKDDEISRMIFTKYGSYFGYMTGKGNYIFKTYINPKMSLSEVKKEKDVTTIQSGDKEGLCSLLGVTLHQYYNKYMYTKEDLKLLYNQFPEGSDIDISKAKIFKLLKP